MLNESTEQCIRKLIFQQIMYGNRRNRRHIYDNLAPTGNIQTDQGETNTARARELKQQDTRQVKRRASRRAREDSN